MTLRDVTRYEKLASAVAASTAFPLDRDIVFRSLLPLPVCHDVLAVCSRRAPRSLACAYLLMISPLHILISCAGILHYLLALRRHGEAAPHWPPREGPGGEVHQKQQGIRLVRFLSHVRALSVFSDLYRLAFIGTRSRQRTTLLAYLRALSRRRRGITYFPSTQARTITCVH